MLAYATVCLIATGLLFAAAVALVQRLAVAHGGTLRVRSDGPGKGSTFTIRLPKAPVPESAAPASGSLPTPAGVRILIIEDQQDVRDSLRILLELDNHEVETAANGREGVAKFDAFSPSVVLVDIGIPEMNGYEVAQRSARERMEPVFRSSRLPDTVSPMTFVVPLQRVSTSI